MKKVLVSGGSRGIGAATVEKFCTLGDKVAFIYKNSDEAANEICDRFGATAIRADVSDPASAREAVEKAIDALSGLDVLVSNAGISHVAQICDVSDSEWRRIVDTNLSAAFYLTREASDFMVKQHSGRIITVGSVWGKCGASCEVAYSTTKAGIRGLTMSLAKELGPSNITVNCVEPGIIDTDMNRCFDGETLRSIAKEIPAGRIGMAMEVAELIAFLASDKASYINGQCIAIDGGWCI